MINKTTRILKLIGLIVAIGVMVPKAITYFAKAKTVNKLDHRIGLSISRDDIHYKEADVRWMRQQTIFERKTTPLTDAEKEIIKNAEEELAKRKARYEERVQQYEEQYNEKSEL